MEHFWAKVKKSDDCWEWTAKRNNKGYGLFRTKPKHTWTFTTASRIAYELTYGPIPKGKWVLHTCDNRGCVRPDHLFLGTHSDNMRDMRNKGRGGTQILVSSDVIKIRRLRAKGIPRAIVATQFGVSIATVKNITMGKTWKHI
jgi:hypothetical protein